MSTLIAVRLPDEMAAFLDRTVATGKAPSRAVLVAAAVEREMRRQAAEQDAQVLREKGPADGWTIWCSGAAPTSRYPFSHDLHARPQRHSGRSCAGVSVVS
ncbi:MAG TPA: hypothetical protein VH419_02280 [Nocardioidaceae bacterium]